MNPDLFQPRIGENDAQHFVPPDIAAEIVLAKISAGLDAGMSLEAMIGECRKASSEQMSPLAAKMMNLAFEGIAIDGGQTSPKLPIDVGRLETDKAQVIEDGIETMSVCKNQIFASIREQVAELMFANGTQRESVVRRIAHTKSRLNALQELVDRGRVPNPEKVIHAQDYSLIANLIKSGRLEAGAANVAADTIRLLQEHAQTYERLIQDSVDWVKNNRQAISNSVAAWSSFCFNPAKYLPFGAQEYRLSDQPVNDLRVLYRGWEMPGMKSAFITTEPGETYGTDAIDALSHFLIDIRPFDATRHGDMLEAWKESAQIAVLSVDEIKARLSETAEIIKQLQMWCTSTHLDLWQDSRFEYEFMMVLCSSKPNNVSERMLGILGTALLKQMTRARVGVFDYAIEVIDSMIEYVQAQLQD